MRIENKTENLLFEKGKFLALNLCTTIYNMTEEATGKDFMSFDV